ncbi:hypothetical protein [Amycolatopsis sp. NPDC059657]|uniref:hypothetical protein n=1 Tax=Amycolatopsis sp. NPDC059657 TaxID=3346899 RepID=UPI00366AD905
MTILGRESLLQAVENVLDSATAEVTRLVGDAMPESTSDEDLRAQIQATWKDVEAKAREIGADWRMCVDDVMARIWPVVAGLQRQIRLLKSLPGRVDGDILAQILGAYAPEQWTPSARAAFADSVLEAMALSGFSVHRVSVGGVS